jgi:hypothetical protein
MKITSKPSWIYEGVARIIRNRVILFDINFAKTEMIAKADINHTLHTLVFFFLRKGVQHGKMDLN